jgi:hypothetical protein
VRCWFRTSWRIVGLAVVLAAAHPSAQPPAATAADPAKLGPQVGARVPGFSLRDQRSNTWTLESIMGAKGAMLVFFRSADW